MRSGYSRLALDAVVALIIYQVLKCALDLELVFLG